MAGAENFQIDEIYQYEQKLRELSETPSEVISGNERAQSTQSLRDSDRYTPLRFDVNDPDTSPQKGLEHSSKSNEPKEIMESKQQVDDDPNNCNEENSVPLIDRVRRLLSLTPKRNKCQAMELHFDNRVSAPGDRENEQLETTPVEKPITKCWSAGRLPLKRPSDRCMLIIFCGVLVGVAIFSCIATYFTTTAGTSHENIMPPTTANLLSVCNLPAGDKRYKGLFPKLYKQPTGFCWWEEDVLIVTQGIGNQTVKVDVNLKRKSCKPSVLNVGYPIGAIICSPYRRETLIWTSCGLKVHDATGVEEWKFNYPDLCFGLFQGDTFAANNKMIVIGYTTENNKRRFDVYNRNRNFLYTVLFDADDEVSVLSHLTNNGLLYIPTFDDSSILIYDMNDNSSRKVTGLSDGYLKDVGGLSSTHGGYILVCSGRNRVSVFTPDGHFLHDLKFTDNLDQDPYSVVVLPREDKPSLMALISINSKNLLIYSLTND